MGKYTEWQQQVSLYNLLGEQLEKYPEMKQGLEDVFNKQKDLFQAQYSNRAEDLSFQTSGSIYDFMTKYRGAQSKSGFGGSGALERGRERGTGRIQQSHEFGMQNLFDSFQERKLGAQKEYLSGLTELEKFKSDLLAQMASMDIDPPTVWEMGWQAISDPASAWEDIGEASKEF